MLAIGIAIFLGVASACSSAGPTYITGSGISDSGYLCVNAKDSMWRSVDTIVPTPASVKGVDGRFTQTGDDSGRFDLGTDEAPGRSITLKRSNPCP